MKKIIVGIILLCTLSLATNVSAQTSAERDQYEIQVDGLGCPFCAYGLEKKFKEFKGIKNVYIEMETGLFTFTYPADKPLSIQQVENQVDAAGYTPITTKIIRTNGSIEESNIEEVVLGDLTGLQESTLNVAGQCGMCEKRIQKAATAVEGVALAEWDLDAQSLLVKYDANSTNIKAIAMAVAQAGHDTEIIKASKAAYKNLHACCKYKRLK